VTKRRRLRQFLLQEIELLKELEDDSGRTRTCNQTGMSGRIKVSIVGFAAIS
jgi:hypothetical protein